MKGTGRMAVKLYNSPRYRDESGAAALEMAIILPLILIILFGIIDFGRLLSARLVLTNVAREGGSLASRDIQAASNLISMLQVAGSPLDLVSAGQIYITQIDAGSSASSPYPTINSASSASGGNLSVQSSIGSVWPNLGLPSNIYQHLVFNSSQNTSDISGVTVVEVYYKYKPISPLSNFIPGLMTGSGGGMIISSRAVF
jgi:Flp pilus assembly pilin Flp